VSSDEIARELIERSLADRTLADRPAPELTRGARVAVYGAGNVGRRVVQLLGAHGIEVDHVVDLRAAQIGSMDGVPVVSPDAMRDRSLPVVIGVFNRAANPQAIHETLRAHGAERIIDFLELHARFASELGDRYWLVAQARLRTHAEAMRRGLARWADGTSREHFARLLAYRLTANPSVLPAPVEGVPYRPADLAISAGPVRFVDGGAFDGDTMRAWEAAGIPVEHYWGFEPDPQNFAALEEYWRTRRTQDVKFELARVALGAHGGTARFGAGGGEASSIGTHGSVDVEVRALDEAIPSGSPTDLKLDIEGAEPSALEGARALILRARPRLALCAYHCFDHLWTIAEWVAALDAGYALYLRPHAHSGFDAVTYGLPGSVR